MKTLEHLHRECFVFEYGGEIVTNAELLRRGIGQKYALALDAHWQSQVSQGDDLLLSMDALRYMNVARWLSQKDRIDTCRFSSMSWLAKVCLFSPCLVCLTRI